MADYPKHLDEAPKAISKMEKAASITEIGSEHYIGNLKKHSINERNDNTALNSSPHVSENKNSAPIIHWNVKKQDVIVQNKQTTQYTSSPTTVIWPDLSTCTSIFTKTFPVENLPTAEEDEPFFYRLRPNLDQLKTSKILSEHQLGTVFYLLSGEDRK